MQPEKIPSWVERILLPGLNELKGEIKELRVDIKRVDEKIGSVRNELKAEIKRIDEKVDLALNIRERLIALEARINALEKASTP